MTVIVPLLRWPAPVAALWLAFAAGAQAQVARPEPQAPPEGAKAPLPNSSTVPPEPARKAAKRGADRATKGTGKHPGKSKVVGALNVNRATEAELRLLPGIGKGRAHAIVERRPKGGYRSVDDLGRIKGLRRLVQKLRTHLTTEGPSTLRPAPEAARGPAN